MDRPNFLVLGAAKSGTTSLCHLLGQHPDVFIPRVKEPVFFEAEYERGLDYYWRTYFSEWSGEPLAGDGRPYNLFLPFVAERVRESLPDARLIAILRDPVDRAYSHWWHRYTRRAEPLGFEAAVDANLGALSEGTRFVGETGSRAWRDGLVHPRAMATRHRIYLDCGHYTEQLRRYRERFDPDRVLVLLYEDLAGDPEATVRRVWEFLGAAPGAPVPDREPRNTALNRRESLVEARLRRALRGRNPFRKLPEPLRTPLRRLLGERAARRPPLATAVRARLVDYYREANRELSELLGRDLAAWSRS